LSFLAVIHNCKWNHLQLKLKIHLNSLFDFEYFIFYLYLAYLYLRFLSQNFTHSFKKIIFFPQNFCFYVVYFNLEIQFCMIKSFVYQAYFFS
jgi:hypothetical protein